MTVQGVAIVVAKDHVQVPVTAQVRVIVWSQVFVPLLEPLPEGAHTIAAVIPHTVPVKVGLAMSALSATALVSALSVLRFVKFVFITARDAEIASQASIDVIVAIVYSYRGEVQVVQELVVQYVSHVADTALHMSGALDQVYDTNNDTIGLQFQVVVGDVLVVQVVLGILYEN